MTRLPWELPWPVALGVTALATGALARLARRAGVGPAPDPSGVRARLAPPVGGWALALGLLAAGGAGPWWAALGALALGTLDDRRDLSPVLKLLGQVAVGLLLVLDLGGDFLDTGAGGAWSHVPGLSALAPGSVGAGALVALLTVVALNAWNTFDHADGTCAGLSALALGSVAPWRAAVLGFLPWNLLRRRGAPGPTHGSTSDGVAHARDASPAVPRAPGPHAYLGDAGSHLLGVLVVARPEAWPFLALPLADLLRLSVVRLAAGSRPWVGDRRHLTHGLQRRGLGPVAAAALALLPAWPLVWAGAHPGPAWAAFGALYLGVAWTGRRGPAPAAGGPPHERPVGPA